MKFPNKEEATWLEESLRVIYELKPEAVCVAAIGEDGNVITGYYNCGARDKVVIAGSIHMDAVMDTIRKNGHILREALDDEDPACEAGEE